LLTLHEKLLLAFVGLLWLLRAFSEPTNVNTLVDHPAMKLTKVAVFCLMLTHVATDAKSVRLLLGRWWFPHFVLGLQA